MSDPHVSFGECKCANCRGFIQMGNVIDLTLDATEVAKMSKLKTTNKGKISYVASGNKLVVNDSQIIDISNPQTISSNTIAISHGPYSITFTLTPTDGTGTSITSTGNSSATSYTLAVTFNEDVTLVGTTLFTAQDSSLTDFGSLGTITGSGNSYSASYSITDTSSSKTITFTIPTGSVQNSSLVSNTASAEITLTYTPASSSSTTTTTYNDSSSDLSVNVPSLSSDTSDYVKLTTLYDDSVSYTTDGSYISALLWMSQATTSSSRNIAPVAGGHEPFGPPNDPFGPDPGFDPFGPDPGFDPFGPDPFGPDPFGPDPFGPDPSSPGGGSQSITLSMQYGTNFGTETETGLVSVTLQPSQLVDYKIRLKIVLAQADTSIYTAPDVAYTPYTGTGPDDGGIIIIDTTQDGIPKDIWSTDGGTTYFVEYQLSTTPPRYGQYVFTTPAWFPASQNVTSQSFTLDYEAETDNKAPRLTFEAQSDTDNYYTVSNSVIETSTAWSNTARPVSFVFKSVDIDGNNDPVAGSGTGIDSQNIYVEFKDANGTQLGSTSTINALTGVDQTDFQYYSWTGKTNNVPVPTASQTIASMTIGIAAGQFTDVANNANTASSATYTFKWPDTIVPEVTSFSVVNDDTLQDVDTGTSQSSVSYSIEAQFSEVVTAVDGVSVLTAVQNQIAGEPAIGEFTNITFSTTTGQLDASFIINQGSNAYTGVNATQIVISLPTNVVQDSAGNKNTNTTESRVFTYVPTITSTGTANAPQSLTAAATPSAITAAINTTSGNEPFWAYFQFDVQANKYYTITTSSPTNTTEQVTTISRPIITIYDSTFTTISQTENYIQQNYQATTSTTITSNLSLNYPYTVSSSDDTTKTPSGTTGSGTIYFVVDASNSANQNVAGSIGGYFQIAVTEVDIAAVPVVETITLNAYQPGSIVYDSVRNQAYDVWQVNLENNKSYRFETSQLGVSADTNISLYYNQDNSAKALEYARENIETNRVGTNDDGGDNSYSKLDYTTSNQGTYYLRVEEFGNNADASYNLLTTLTSSFLTPHLNYNRNSAPNTNATNVLIYGYGTSENSPSSSYNNSTDPLYDYFNTAGVPYALSSYITSSATSTNAIQDPTPDEKTAIKNALEAWTYPMGMPIYEFETTAGGTGANGQLHNAANFKIYIINSADSVLNGLQGLAYPPGYSGNNGTNNIIMMEGYILFVRNSTSSLWTGSLLPGGYGYNVILHEFGHAFGFAHPFDTGGGSSGIFPGVDASNALIPDDYNTFRLGEQNYNQNAGTVMAYTNTYKYNQYNFYLGEDATAYVTDLDDVNTAKYMQITPTTLDLAVLMTLYNYPRDSAQSGSKRYYLDPEKNTNPTHVGWTTITDRLTGTTDKIILDASNIESDVVLDLRRPLIQVWDSTSSSYNSVDASNVELMRFSYAMTLNSVTYNSSNEPNVPQTPNSTTGYALNGGFSFSQVARAPGGIDAIGPTDLNTVNPSCLIYSNLGVETSNADTSSGPASGPGNFVDGTGKSNINGGKVKTDSTGITSVVYSKLASSFLNYYEDVPTNWQNTYYFDINDTDNTIGVYLGNGARYDGSGELDAIPTSFSHGYDEIATNTITQFVFNNYNFPSEPVSVVPVDSVCLAEGSEVMVWNINTKESYYKEIQNITEDDYVVTYGHGPKKVVGVTKSYNLPVNISTWEKKKPGKLSKTQAMYHLSKDDFPELKKDLYLTGGHSILKPEMSKSERKEMNKIDWPRKFRQVDGLWKVLTHCTSKAKPVNKLTKVYNLVLEQEDMNDMFKNYGIYANGLLVESCNIQHIIRVKKLEDMMSRDRKMKEGLINRSKNSNKQEKKAICN